MPENSGSVSVCVKILQPAGANEAIGSNLVSVGMRTRQHQDADGKSVLTVQRGMFFWSYRDPVVMSAHLTHELTSSVRTSAWQICMAATCNGNFAGSP